MLDLREGVLLQFLGVLISMKQVFFFPGRFNWPILYRGILCKAGEWLSIVPRQSYLWRYRTGRALHFNDVSFTLFLSQTTCTTTRRQYSYSFCRFMCKHHMSGCNIIVFFVYVMVSKCKPCQAVGLWLVMIFLGGQSLETTTS